MKQHIYTVFFDLEKNVFNIDHKNNFLEYFLIETIPEYEYADKCYKRYLKKIKEKVRSGAKLAHLNKMYFKNFTGMQENLLSEIAESWFDNLYQQAGNGMFNAKTIFEIDMHKRNGAEIVFLSSSFRSQIAGIINKLGVDDVICASLEKIKGYYTGNILSDPISCLGKVRAMECYTNSLQADFNAPFVLKKENKVSSFYDYYEENILGTDGKNSRHSIIRQ